MLDASDTWKELGCLRFRLHSFFTQTAVDRLDLLMTGEPILDDMMEILDEDDWIYGIDDKALRTDEG